MTAAEKAKWKEKQAKRAQRKHGGRVMMKSS